MKNILIPLESHFLDTLNIHGANPEDVVFILNNENRQTCLDEALATAFLNEKFPGVSIKYDDSFEGSLSNLP